MMRTILTLYVSVFLLASCAAPDTSRRPETIRVMTYNIHHGEDFGGELSLDRIADLIARHDVDIVALQEVDSHWAERSGFADQPRELAERLGMEVFFAPIYDRDPEPPREERRRYGLAVLSRLPILSKSNLDLARQTIEDEVMRLPGFPAVTLDAGARPLHVFNTHLDYRADPAMRRTQIAETLEVLEDVDGPMILLGDLNARPDATELEPLLARLSDAWQMAGDGDGFTFPADAPDRRIDYILVSGDIRVDSITVVPSTASDHRPVIAVLSIGAPAE